MGASPRIQRPSGVKLSGPLKKVCSPMRFRIGRRSDGQLQLAGQMIPVVGQVEELAVVGDLAVGQRLALGLEEADQQLAGFLLDVGALVRHAQHRQVARDVGARIGDDVEMLGRHQRHVDASHAADLARPQPRAVDDELGAHRALPPCRRP